ncbi:ComEA family DNA-binding protein [Selenomonas caprae]|uniref:ComEA family DNA-binding protein n=1 Tax=Selenomonas caprae TaxID=2606905 RepID=A0A5D6WUS5_9FIRM|nr:ComEA family DNA-binding protein [Selenomonas caprae]TYZ30718.1 ComEA family DNA-binding protein [Selenomonas caprae]
MPMYKKSMFILLVLLLAAAGGTMYGVHMQEQAVALDAAEVQEEKDAKAAITVYVTGAVSRPGVVTLREGARAAEAVNACGGLLPTADQERVNMAQPLQDGQQLRVPEKKAGDGKTAAGSQDGNGCVNINTADEKELDSLPGVGPAMAKRIIEYRETQGSFERIEDIKKVRGIGEAKFAKMKDKLCI